MPFPVIGMFSAMVVRDDTVTLESSDQNASSSELVGSPLARRPRCSSKNTDEGWRAFDSRCSSRIVVSLSTFLAACSFILSYLAIFWANFLSETVMRVATIFRFGLRCGPSSSSPSTRLVADRILDAIVRGGGSCGA